MATSHDITYTHTQSSSYNQFDRFSEKRRRVSTYVHTFIYPVRVYPGMRVGELG
jgi:hypothetical protein